MPRQTHLFLTLSRAGWGEASFGLYLAEQLRRRNENVLFLRHAGNEHLFAGTPFENHPIGDHIGTLIWPLIKECARENNIASVVLCDSWTTDGFLRRCKVDGAVLFELGVPVIGVDTWDNVSRADPIDIFGTERKAASDWVRRVAGLLPCPIVRPSNRAGVCRFLNSPVSLAKRVRAHVRDGWGLRPTDSVILFCTASWQQTTYNDADGDRCAVTFPALLAQYASELGPDVHFVHVGPAPLEPLQRIGGRYKWLPPLGNKFDLALGAVDLLVSANASATTVNKAIASQIPVLILENSCRASALDEAIEWLGNRATPQVIEWLTTALPIFPFRLWPIGLYKFITPILHENPYADAAESVEWLDRQKVIDRTRALLFSVSIRAELQQRQHEYCCRIQHLPTAAESFDSLLVSQLCAA